MGEISPISKGQTKKSGLFAFGSENDCSKRKEKNMERLASAILIQAVKDWEIEKDKAEILAFLASDWFEMLVEAAGLERDRAPAIRAQFETRTYQPVSLRAAYR